MRGTGLLYLLKAPARVFPDGSWNRSQCDGSLCSPVYTGSIMDAHWVIDQGIESSWRGTICQMFTQDCFRQIVFESVSIYLRHLVVISGSFYRSFFHHSFRWLLLFLSSHFLFVLSFVLSFFMFFVFQSEVESICGYLLLSCHSFLASFRWCTFTMKTAEAVHHVFSLSALSYLFPPCL